MSEPESPPTSPPENPENIPICAIGASAGGVKALRQLFSQLPDDLGMAYVVIVHLSPEHPSVLAEILAGCTKMPVHQVQDTPELRSDHVYVISPDKELVIEGDNVHARDFTEPRGHRAPVDVFFRSVATARGDGMAVVLSGAGADGSIGVRAVKEAGGVVFAQDPAEAEFSAMPQNTIATGVVSFIAPIETLAERIAEVARSKEAVRSLDQDGVSNDLRRIVGFLRARTGHDFSSYKKATVMRRVLRRMQVCRITDLKEYGEYVRSAPEEAQELFSDLLISVTQFFRDEVYFQALTSKVIAPLLEDAERENDDVRMWSVGCATGEEAYSLAILVLEESETLKITPQIQIFASDLDEGALGTAREGRYPKSIAADVSQERLARFFVDERTHYRVRKEVRDIVLFASHSVLKDPPFMRLDLIACRNLLIYLERSLQEQLLNLFHYGLNPNGCLFLGSAESADVGTKFFAPLDREARIFRSKSIGRRHMPTLPHVSAEDIYRPNPRQMVVHRERHPVAAEEHVQALERMGPPSVLVDESGEIVHLSPSAGRFIRPSAGAFSAKLADVLRPELRLDLKVGLDRALQGNLATLTHPVSADFEGESRRVALQVLPLRLPDAPSKQALVLLLDAGPSGVEQRNAGGTTATGDDESRPLLDELKAAQEALVVSRTEHELAIEDLRAANEELQSINEEYRSASEELETSKEELQSMNEELQTVNSELKSKLENISTAHSDLRNLTAATEIGTLFLDSKLRIRMFTPPTAELFNITEMDVGRNVTDFTHRLRHDGIEKEARQVLRDLAPVESEIQSSDGRWFIMRLRPYRTVEDRIEGVVLTFVDVTSRRDAEWRLKSSQQEYRTLFDSIDEAFAVMEVLVDDTGAAVDSRMLEVNSAFHRQTGLDDVIGKTLGELIPDLEPEWFEILGRITTTGEAERFEAPVAALGRFYEAYAFPAGAPEDRRAGMLFRDISDRKRSEEHQEMLKHELSHRVKNTLAVVLAITRQPVTKGRSVNDFRDQLGGRIRALAHAHDQLLQTDWRTADLGRLVAATLSAYGSPDDGQLFFSGPQVLLTPRQALSLALVLHELGTNAAKYGSLSNATGRLEVRWNILEAAEGPQVEITWRERDGPPVPTKTTAGFGMQLIEQAGAYELDGTVDHNLAPEGLDVRIQFPMEQDQNTA
jgi:two-component system, chemotaxis family, CheB/CheR fusion protein